MADWPRVANEKGGRASTESTAMDILGEILKQVLEGAAQQQAQPQ